jgi:acyl carrier protein
MTDQFPTTQSIEAELVLLLRKVDPALARVQIEPDERFSDAGLSSLQVMLLVFEADERFEVELEQIGVQAFSSLSAMAALILSLRQKKAAAR